MNTQSVFKKPKIVTSERLFSLSSLSSKASSSYDNEKNQSNIVIESAKYINDRRVSQRDKGKVAAEEQFVFNSDSISAVRGLD